MMLLLWAVTMQVAAEFLFGQDHNTHGILAVPILSLEAPVDDDTEGSSCELRVLLLLLSF